MKNVKIGFIGAGNMAGSLIGGLIKNGVEPGKIRCADPSPAQCNNIRMHHQVECVEDNNEIAAWADVLVLAVKPQMLYQVASNLAVATTGRRPVIISIVAGIRLGDLRRWLDCEPPLIRAMPNTPALIGAGTTGLFASETVNSEQRDSAESLMRAVGSVIWVQRETDLDSVTAVSGSGPAYFMYFMESMQQAAEELGLTPDQARLLIMETALGSARMAMESPVGFAELRQRVTSPGGTTERALAVLEEHKTSKQIGAAVKAAAARSRELADLLGDK